MEGQAVAATIGVLVQNLITISTEELSLIRGDDKNAEKLKENLVMIQSFLDDAENKFIADGAVKRWIQQLQAVAFDADNVLDEMNYHRLSRKIKKKVPSCFPSFNHCVRRRQLALRINEISSIFERSRKNAVELGLEGRLAAAPAAPVVAPTETDSITVDPIFIGRDGDVSKIVGMLTAPTEQALSILPIVGMGGLAWIWPLASTSLTVSSPYKSLETHPAIYLLH